MRKHLLATAAIVMIASSNIAVAQTGAAPRSGGSVNPSTTQGAGAAPTQPGVGTSQGAGSLGEAANSGTTVRPGTCGPGSSAPTMPCPPSVGGSSASNPGGATNSGKSGVTTSPSATGGESTE
jgi:hypothetical protein